VNKGMLTSRPVGAFRETLAGQGWPCPSSTCQISSGVGACLAAEVSRSPGPRLAQPALVEAERQASQLGQERGPILPAGQDLPQLGHRSGRLGPVRLVPASGAPRPPRSAGR
jgi:hypothetical protein